VYGKQPKTMSHLSEDAPCSFKLQTTQSPYAIGKCVAEQMACLYASQHNFAVKIARCFSFLGPYLSLTNDFAITNFLKAGLNGEPIIIKGDGTALRSYLYATDLVIWLWTILLRGATQRPYNVGSDVAYPILKVAQLVAKNLKTQSEVKAMKTPLPNELCERYIPDISRVRCDLNLTPLVDLEDAIQRTKNWYTSKGLTDD